MDFAYLGRQVTAFDLRPPLEIGLSSLWVEIKAAIKRER